MSTRRPLTALAATAITLFGLAGCGSLSEAAPAPEQSQAQADSQVDSQAESQSSEELPDATERKVPAECAALNLELGAKLEGAPFGECVALALSSFGSGKMQIAGDVTGDFEFTYDPDFNVQGEQQSPTGSLRVAFIDSEIWIDSGNGPVKGDLNSENEEEILAGLAGELTRQYSDPAEVSKLVQEQAEWHIDDELVSVTTVDGSTTEAYRIVSAGAFSWNEIPITEYVLWYGEDWVPLSTQATMEMMGLTSVNSQSFYDLGEPIVIKPLG